MNMHIRAAAALALLTASLPAFGASATATRSWNHLISRSLSSSSGPSAIAPARTPCWTRSTSTRSSRPTWSSNASSSSIHASSASGAKK
jgi:hypothetical protein